MAPIPVTILTGFLGSGKTTVLNHVLKAPHGKRIAVIENEFGEVGIDNELVFCAKDDLFNMESGCVCCTIRPDLIRILGELVNREDAFDHIVIETTGLADPAPVAQTFFVDEEIKARARLDAVVTVVDAKHFLERVEESRACLEQIAFADIILVNKCDLASSAEMEAVEARIRATNALARIHRITDGHIPHTDFLDQGGFDLDRAVQAKPAFLRDEYPFERAATYDLVRGTHELVVKAGREGTMALALLPAGRPMRDLEHEASAKLVAAVDDESKVTLPEGLVKAGEAAVIQVREDEASRFFMDVGHTGLQVLFTQYGPDEFGFDLLGPDGQQTVARDMVDYMAGHAHDGTITSVSVTTKGHVDQERVAAWLRDLVAKQGQDIFRLKGILDVGHPERLVVHGVHMRLDAKHDRPWGEGEARSNQLVFIGRNLDRKQLAKGFRSCRATRKAKPKALRMAA